MPCFADSVILKEFTEGSQYFQKGNWFQLNIKIYPKPTKYTEVKENILMLKKQV